jgi:hypothetical protein
MEDLEVTDRRARQNLAWDAYPSLGRRPLLLSGLFTISFRQHYLSAVAVAGRISNGNDPIREPLLQCRV